MMLIFISIITGFIGLLIGSSINAENILGLVGFLSPTIFVVQKIYKKLEDRRGQVDKYLI